MSLLSSYDREMCTDIRLLYSLKTVLTRKKHTDMLKKYTAIIWGLVIIHFNISKLIKLTETGFTSCTNICLTVPIQYNKTIKPPILPQYYTYITAQGTGLNISPIKDKNHQTGITTRVIIWRNNYVSTFPSLYRMKMTP